MTERRGKDGPVPSTASVRSVCIITREFPPDTSYGGIARVAHMQARALVEAGVAVHVLTLAPDGNTRMTLDDGVVVHRIAQPGVQSPPDMGYVVAGIWSQAVAEQYRRLDTLVRFDAVLAQDYHAETLHLVRRPETPLIVTLHAPMKVVDGGCGRSTTPGQRSFAELEGVALRGADLLLHPTELVLAETRRAFGEDGLPPAALCPFPVDVGRFAVTGRESWSGGTVRVVFVGRLEPLKGADLALRAVAAARRRGVDARITLVGRDVPQADGSSYRRGVLVPLLAQLDLDFGDVRFVDQVDECGVAQHLRHADVALLPSLIENFHTAAVEALAAGVPVITGGRNGLACWVSAEDGLRTVAGAALGGDPTAFVEGAADALADAAWLSSAGARAAARVAEAFDPAAVTARLLELVGEAVAMKAAGVPGTTPAPAPVTGDPSLGIIVLAHNALAYTLRCVRSLVAHTDTAFRVVVVDNASTDGTAAALAGIDSRVEVVSSEVNLGVSGGRNAGLATLAGGSHDYVVFLDNDVELLAGWWRPFHDALAGTPQAAIAGERGVRVTVTSTGREIETLTAAGLADVDMAIGFCMVMRAEAVAEIGRFDENMGLFWHDDDDYGMRARRLGWRVLHVGSQRVLHFEHRSSRSVDGIWDAAERPSDLSRRNQAYLAEKWRRRGQAGGKAASLGVLAFADELVERPELLRAYAATFSSADPVLLAIYAPGREENELFAALGPVVDAAGLSADGAPDVVALAVDPGEETALGLAHGIDCVLTGRAPTGTFAAPAHFDADSVDRLADLVERFRAAASGWPLVVAA